MNARPSQRRIRLKRDDRGVGISLVVLAGLVAVPACALLRLADRVDWRFLVAAPAAISFVAIFLYRHDKRAAESGRWRIPEFTLHLTELLGGWPGAYLAQRMYRHKTSKTSYQIEFWFIVLVHEYAAADFLTGWRLAKEILRFIRSVTA